MSKKKNTSQTPREPKAPTIKKVPTAQPVVKPEVTKEPVLPNPIPAPVSEIAKTEPNPRDEQRIGAGRASGATQSEV